MSSIQQIDAELRALEARRGSLIEERKKLIESPVAADPPPQSSFLSPSDKITLFLSLFRCRGDVYPKLWENEKSGRKGSSPACNNEGFKTVCEKPKVKCSECFNQAFPPLDEVATRAHLTGKQTIGTYAIREDNTCVFLAADFDGAGWREDIRAYREAARAMEIEVAVERSRSGNGGHAWIFFSEPVPALLARRLGTLIVAKASSIHPAMSLASYDRFFPNQDVLPAGGFGNLIALPLQEAPRKAGNSVFLDEEFAPHPDQWDFLASIKRISPETLTEQIDHTLSPETDAPAEPVRFEDRVLDVIPSAVTRGVFTGCTTAIRRAQLEIATSDLPALKRMATLANPKFFERQRLRFGTYNIPRFIFCGEIHPKILILPRGVISAAKDLFRKAGGTLEIDDQRPAAKPFEFSFHGELSPDQQGAVIASRKVSTLILVHRKPLMEQWKSRLQQFLNLNQKDIGILKGNDAAESSGVVIGMVQTLAKPPHPEALLAPFNQVIIDECHHIPAASFEAVMKACPARHFLGLTATPNRKDGLQKILFRQCGPIRTSRES